MHCKQCEPTTTGRRAGFRRRVSASLALDALLCEQCGSLLPPVDQSERMLKKLSQLARFGLDAGAHPILADPTRRR